MLTWGKLESETLYVMDLLQWEDGMRAVRFREPHDPPHLKAVLHSKPYAGQRLRQFMRERFYSPEILTDDGQPFGLDPHDVWVTQAEAEYLRAHRLTEAPSSPHAPWVNNLPPRFPEK